MVVLHCTGKISLGAKMMCLAMKSEPRKKTHGAIIQIVTPLSLAKTGSERHDVKCAGRTLGQFPEVTA